jgi:hypothetical protein
MCESDDTSASEQAALIGTAGQLQGQVIELSNGVRLGRHSRNDICLDDHTVSLFHAEITLISGEYEIDDLGSKNGTKLNGRKIRRSIPLADDDVIEVGSNTFRFRPPQMVPSGPVAGVPGRLGHTSDRRACSSKAVALAGESQGRRAPDPMAAGKRGDHQVASAWAAAEVAAHQPPSRGKARRSVITLALCSGPAFLGGLVVAWLLLVELPLHTQPNPSQHGTLSARQPERNAEAHLTPLRPIWAKWEATKMREPTATHTVRGLLSQALNEADQVHRSTPDAWWRLYKTCLGLVQAALGEPEDSDLRRQAEQLLVRVKIEMEDQSERLRRRLSQARKAGQYAVAYESLQGLTQLMDLELDNKDSELARRYAALEQAINLEKTAR